MTRIIIGITAMAVATTLFQSAPAHAQERWNVELRGTGGISTQDAARDTHENGFGIEAAVQYRIMSHLAAYAGWNYTQFGGLETIAGPDMELDETGYALGLRFEHPLRTGGRTSGWVRSGMTYNQLEIESSDGVVAHESGHGFGWEFGAGLSVPVRGLWSVTPGIRYRSISRNLDIANVVTPVELQSVAFELGLSRSF